MSLFAVQHSVMARQGFKRWWTQFVPPAIERSSFVLAATLALMLLLWQWQPIPTIVWETTDPMAAMALTGLSLTGWVIVLASTFMIITSNCSACTRW
jgi:protein-S-isoprenylcysteine O-methyltransferase Ste14